MMGILSIRFVGLFCGVVMRVMGVLVKWIVRLSIFCCGCLRMRFMLIVIRCWVRMVRLLGFFRSL